MKRIKNICYITLITSAIIPMLCRYIVDSDIWWHMSHGRELLMSGKVNPLNMYTSTVNPVISSLKTTWLGDILLFCVFQIGQETGLQILRAEIIVVMLWLLWGVSDKKLNFFKCVIMISVVIGCYQLELIRNSIFSIPFVCLLWYWFLTNHKYKHIYSFGLLVVWSVIHGSVLLGLGLYALLCLSTMEFSIRKLIAGIVTICAGYWIVNQHYNINGYFQLPDTFNLNQTIFKPTGDFISADFMSPFADFQPYFAIVLLMSLFYIVMVKKARLVYVLPFLATLVLALGYKRMIGYHAISCGFGLIYAESRRNLKCNLKPVYYGIISVFLFFSSWVFYGPGAGLGVDPVFSATNTGKYIKKEVLASETLASYLYFKYGIRSFWDTCYSAHAPGVLKAYLTMIQNPDSIPKPIETCVMTPNEAGFFRTSKIWKLAYFKNGCFIFVR